MKKVLFILFTFLFVAVSVNALTLLSGSEEETNYFRYSFLKVKEKMLQEKVGEFAGVIWNILNGTNGMTLKDIKAEAKKNDVKLLDKDAYMALGWLMRENKLEVTEDGKDLFIKLI